jgi:hypothetical protein
MNTKIEGALRLLAVFGLALLSSSIAIGTAIGPAISPAVLA